MILNYLRGFGRLCKSIPSLLSLQWDEKGLSAPVFTRGWANRATSEAVGQSAKTLLLGMGLAFPLFTLDFVCLSRLRQLKRDKKYA